jgi:quercetin dioxygenase-like cupin family protein
MSLHNQIHTVGRLQFNIYDFEKIGDVLPMHSHPEGQTHISIVSRGSFKVHGPDYEGIHSEGAVIDFEPEQAHEFTALEDNSRVINVVK